MNDVSTSDRHAQGLRKLKEIGNGPGQDTTAHVMEVIRKVAPHLERQVYEFVLGDVLSRPGLDTKQRELINVAVLTALGAELELKLHAHVALNCGCTRTEVAEAVAQQAVYAGFPRAINGLKVLGEVYAERDAQGVSN
jgi:4-carboxymuconolactone decarboxylase